MKIREHNGYTIDYNLDTKRFEAYEVTEGKVTLYAETEQSLTDKIDASVKRREKAKKSGVFPIDVIYKPYNEIFVGKITSVADDGDIWVSFIKDGKTEREKKTTRYGTPFDFYKPNEANLLKLKECEDKKKAIAKLGSEMVAIRNSLTDRIDIDKLMRELNS